MVDRYGIVAADIETRPYLVRFGGAYQRVDRIGHIREITRLLAVADDGERLAGEQLSKEHAKNRAVGAAGARPRPVNIEETKGQRRQAVDLRPMHHLAFAQPLGQ